MADHRGGDRHPGSDTRDAVDAGVSRGRAYARQRTHGALLLHLGDRRPPEPEWESDLLNVKLYPRRVSLGVPRAYMIRIP